MTSEERGQHNLCGAKKKNGDLCRAFSGQGTDHLGIGACKNHGGSMTNHKKHAVAIEAKAAMIKMGQPLDSITPAQAMLNLLRASSGHVQWLMEECMSLDDLGTPEAAVLLSMYDSERDRLVRISEAATRAGVSTEEVRVEEAQAREVIKMVHAAAKEAGLSDSGVRALGAALRKVIAQSSALGDDDPERREREAAEAEQRLARARAEMQEREEQRIAAAAAKRPPADLAYPPDEWVPDAEVVSDPEPSTLGPKVAP